MSDTAKTLVVLFALLLPALLYGLGNRPLYKIQEVRIAETAREMWAGGDWLVPRYNGELRLQKPPLPYWLTAASYRLLGVGEAAARLPAALLGALAAALLFLWAKRESGPHVAANSALILVASYLGIRYFRSAEADALLLFCICLACMLGYRLVRGQAQAGYSMLFGLALGLGFLAKGPAGIAVPVLTVLGYAFVEKRLSALRPCLRPLPVALMLAVGAGWYAWIGWSLPEAAQQFFGRQVDETFISGTHAKPVWWYFAHAPELFAPWSPLLLPAAVWAQRTRPLPPLLRFALVWLGVASLLLMLTVNKQTQYAMLLLPPVALWLAHYLQLATGMLARLNRVLFILFCVSGVAAVLWSIHTLGWAGMASAWWLALPLLAYRLTGAGAPTPPLLLVAALTLAGYLYGERYLSSEPGKNRVRDMMVKAAQHRPLYQSFPGDGAVSYYAGQVVPPLKPAALPAVLAAQPAIWLLAAEAPVGPGIQAVAAETMGEQVLWRVTRAP